MDEESQQSIEQQEYSNQEQISAFKNYILQAANTFLDVSEAELNKFLILEKQLSNIKKFIFNGQQNIFILNQKVQNVFQLYLDYEQIVSGECLIILKKQEFNYDPDFQNDFQTLKSNLNVFHFGNIDQDFNLEKMTYNIIRNGFNPFLKQIGQVAETYQPYKFQNPLSAKLYQERETLKGLQMKFDDLEDILIQNNSKEIPVIKLNFDSIITVACQEAFKQGRPANFHDISEEYIMNEAFIANLQEKPRKWLNMTNRLVGHSQNIYFDSLESEINYWKKYQIIMQQALEQFKCPEVLLIIDVLKHKKKIIKGTEQISENSLQNKLQQIDQIVEIMKEIPICQLREAKGIKEVYNVMVNIFTQIRKIISNSSYPHEKWLKLLDNFSQDISNQIIKIFNSLNILKMPFSELEELNNNYKINISNAWNSQIKNIKELSGTSSNEAHKMPLIYKIMKLVKLGDRLRNINAIRESHETIKSIIQDIYNTKDMIAMKNKAIDIVSEEKIQQVFDECFGKLDLFDLSPDGDKKIDWSKKNYDDKIDTFEMEIILQIRELLGSVKSTKEMYGIFQKFLGLMKRPQVRQAVQEYQEQLMKKLVEQSSHLVKKYQNTFDHFDNRLVAKYYGIPQLSGNYIWGEQINQHLQALREKIQIVIGDKYKTSGIRNMGEQQGEKKIEYEKYFEQFSKLREKKVIDDDFEKFQIEFSGKMLIISSIPGTKQQCVGVNFSEELQTVIENQRNLIKLNNAFKLNMSKKYYFKKNVWPLYINALKLSESVKIWNQLSQNIDNKLCALLSKQLKKLFIEIENGLQMDWQMKDVENHQEKYMLRFSDLVYSFEMLTNHLIEKIQLIDELIKNLSTCNHQEFPSIIKQIQNIIDKLILKEYTNIETLTLDTNAKIEKVLIKRLTETLSTWMEEFQKFKYDNKQNSKNKLIKQPSFHEINVFNNIIVINPPIQSSKQIWLNNLHQHINQFTSLQKLQANSYQSPIQKACHSQQESFSNILEKLGSNILAQVYKMLNDKMYQAENYGRQWTNYQALWEINISTFYANYGENLSTWQIILSEIKKGRSTFDNSQFSTNYGPVIIHYKQVQLKINNIYDQLHKQILNEFGKQFCSKLEKYNKMIIEWRNKLENLSFGTASELVENISAMNYCKDNIQEWEDDISKYNDYERLLQQQKFNFPETQKIVSQVAKEFTKVQTLYKKKSELFDQNIENFKRTIANEEDVVLVKISNFEAMCQQQKPDTSSHQPEKALEILSNLQKQLKGILSNVEKLNCAKQQLKLPIIEQESLQGMGEDMELLKKIWCEIQRVYLPIEGIMDVPFQVANPISNNKIFDGISTDLQELSDEIKNHQIVTGKRKELFAIRKKNRTIADLKSDAMKEQHLNKVLRVLKIDKQIPDLYMRDFFKINFEEYEKQIAEIISIAQGELVLENMLKKIKEFWKKEKFQLSNYQEKCQLIKGWNDIIERTEEDIGQLQSMKLSQHFKTFESDIKTWFERLQFVFNVLSQWMDVQRKWVYLEGIFMGSSDIKQQLGSEYDRFQNINREFIGIMKIVSHKQKVLEIVFSIDNIQQQLEYISETLDKIQKSLSDYLENQRQSFSRFYFVGDEDLLEIIGNSKDINSIQKYFSKMFAGIHSIANEEKGNVLTHMVSKEMEHVPFNKSISISSFEKINLWLTELELQMQFSLALLLTDIMVQWKQSTPEQIVSIAKSYPTQILLLGLQVYWTFLVEQCFLDKSSQKSVEELLRQFLSLLAQEVLQPLDILVRKRYEQLITEFVHMRDVTRVQENSQTNSQTDFVWTQYLRFYYNTGDAGRQDNVIVRMGNSSFKYGYEYLGITDKLVQTPLTDKCYFTLTQALSLRMGGAPFGPAGTGKTESVKALGNTLGNFVLVFNCDENFNFKAMGRIFIGLAQVGAWGCFDEFNRLEEKILSAVSQQILIIQSGLREDCKKIELMSKSVNLNHNLGIFVTMNPCYAGRSNLPENLKQLFRQMAMVTPDSDLIAQVMLFSQGFKSAEHISSKIVSLFELCLAQLSSQPHYDFGLRALKSVLNSAGNLKRKYLQNKLSDDPHSIHCEQSIILQSFCATVMPKLISEDTPLIKSLIKGVFPLNDITSLQDEFFNKIIEKELERRFLNPLNKVFLEKILQLNQILNLHHGVMLVGPTGNGKSSAWKTLLSSLTAQDKIKGESYIIDPKALSKEELYGKLDNTTMEWTDGIFTHILRKICENQRGESQKRHWIIFDGDVDPEWAENLNSVLDDNKMLTLPNGERLPIPLNVKIMFEVDTLKYATLATISRCGMVWFSADILSDNDIFHHYLQRLQEENYDTLIRQQSDQQDSENNILRKACVEYIKDIFIKEDQVISIASLALQIAHEYPHVMELSKIRQIEALFALIRKGVTKVIEKNEETFDNYSQNKELVQKFIVRWTLFALNWSLAGDLKLEQRSAYFNQMREACTYFPKGFEFPITDNQITLIDYEVSIENGEYIPWNQKVPFVDLPFERVAMPDTVITTVDTLRHQEVLCSWILENRPFIICGPPGSGKTMTLMATLKALENYDMIFVNFSSQTTPQLIIKQLDHYCEYNKGADGITLKPRQPNKQLVVFCDEINLPDEDKYGTQCVISFLRQLIEQKGFWRAADKQWIGLERVQFVGACNPPTDSGRHPLSPRFLRHCPLLLVDFPGMESLTQIYGTFNRSLLKRKQNLKPFADSLTGAMIEYYQQSQQRFTQDQQPHYIYSPRELTRWKYGISEALDQLNSIEELIRLWAHEALRLFEDRLVLPEEKRWCQEKVDEIAQKYFPGISAFVLQRPIIYSAYLTKCYQSVKVEDLREYIITKLKFFNEEMYDVQLVIFDDVIDHIAKIDRVLRQPIGHMLLVGASGVGKTTLSRFVSWLNGLKVFQIKAGRNYSLANFEDDLRYVMKRAGCRMEKTTFIFDESNILSAAFMERMNALLASGEIPGLFEGEEYQLLINQYRECSTSKVKETEQEIYQNFIWNVQKNLHVIFTMNPASEDFGNRAASSPAIFNRCVIDWFGDWSEQALRQVALELTKDMDCGKDCDQGVIVDLIVRIHKSVCKLNQGLKQSSRKFNYLTPRDFLDFIKHFKNLYKEKKKKLIEQQQHLLNGLQSLKITEESVSELKSSLYKYDEELEQKNNAAKQKLELIMEQQKESKSKIEDSVRLKEQINTQKGEIEEGEQQVQKELAEVEPELERAKKAVESLNKTQINELRTYKQPPKLVQNTLEVVLYMTKGVQLKWEEMKAETAKPDFLSSIINFQTTNLTEKLRQTIQQEYFSKTEWNIETIYKSSKAAGPLAQWAQSQFKYSHMIQLVKPLNDKINQMAEEREILEQKLDNLSQVIKQLEQKIKELKNEYSQLIATSQILIKEKEAVQIKLAKAENLLFDLKNEKGRWEKSSKDFGAQFCTLTGDVFISAAFLTYIGFFDQYYRDLLIKTWYQYLDQTKIKYKPNLSLIEYLSMPSDRLTWMSKGLPQDDLCFQNAIILQRFNRYPLIIDPAGQAIEFLIRLHSDIEGGESKFIKTSFVDDSFMKQLETSLRFGLTILIQDVEKIEPILNNVLNKEIIRSSGRSLIRVGDQEVDFSNQFKLFMITRNSEAKLSPDICSRVSFVNFTVTKASLENQFINIYLKNERPDVEQKRIQLLKLQGEYIVKLRMLEDDLLNQLSETEGQNILENEEVIEKLAQLKRESKQIEQEQEQQDVSLKENDAVTEQYRQIASISSKLFFSIQQLQGANNFYSFSLKFYFKCVHKLLQNDVDLICMSKSDYEKRLELLTTKIFEYVFKLIGPSILEKDKYLAALIFAQIKLQQEFPSKIHSLLQLLVQPSTSMTTTFPDTLLQGILSRSQKIRLEEFSHAPFINNLLDNIKQNERKWTDYIIKGGQQLDYDEIINYQYFEPEINGQDKYKSIVTKLVDVIITTIIRPQQGTQKVQELIEQTFGVDLLGLIDIDLQKAIEQDSESGTPIILLSAPGFDPSNKIYEIAKTMQKKYTDIAIGSAEGFDHAHKALQTSTKKGHWIILKNVHLAPQWLQEIEKDLFSQHPHDDFRLFLLAEFTNKLPPMLVKRSIKFIFELPNGIKQSVRRTYKLTYSSLRSDRLPKERARLHFLLAWIHAIIMERLRYVSTGWSKKYEFSEADLRCALDVIDQFIDLQGERQNISPDQLPFKALQQIITDNIYGGKIDNQFDLRILHSIVCQYINAESFNTRKTFIQDKNGDINNPEAFTHQEFKQWVDALSAKESPNWYGLPIQANDLVNRSQTDQLLSSFRKIQQVNEGEISMGDEKSSSDNGQRFFLDELSTRVRNYLSLLPTTVSQLQRSEQLINNPLFRILERELTLCQSLLADIRSVFVDIDNMATGKAPAQQNIKKLSQSIMSNEVAAQWKRYQVPDTLVFADWLNDFKNRVEQLNKLAELEEWQCSGIELGLFLFPGAFITASRQYVATNNKLSMDELDLKASFTSEQFVEKNSFKVNTLWIEGANWTPEGLVLSDEISSEVKNIKFTWVKKSELVYNNCVNIPLYLNQTRQNLILSLRFDITGSDISVKNLYQRGVALILWKL